MLEENCFKQRLLKQHQGHALAQANVSAKAVLLASSSSVPIPQHDTLYLAN